MEIFLSTKFPVDNFTNSQKVNFELTFCIQYFIGKVSRYSEE